MYTPETIIELSGAYNNARVIAKPDYTWLGAITKQINKPKVRR